MRIITNSTDFYHNISAMVYTHGYEECAPQHSYGPAVRKSYMFHYITQGKGIFYVNEKAYYLKKGDIFFIKPGQEIYYEADEKDPWGYGWIGLTGYEMENYLKRTTFWKEPVASYTQSYDLELLFVEMQRAYIENEEIRDLKLNEIMYKFLVFLTLNFPASHENNEWDSKEVIKKIMEYCISNIEKPIRVQKIADLMGLERSYLSRLFKKETKISLKDYIWKTKEDEACHLLKTTNLPVQIIARSVGYEDSLHFSKIFKTKKGISPKEYRKKHNPADLEH